MNTKLKLTLSILVTFCITAFAGEGMWMPQLLKSLNEKDMKDAGMLISADDLYNTNKSSIKDAICLFGAGCTAEVISDKGLILTNHHCGFDAVQQLSSIVNDYIRNGYWAKNMTEEKPCAGLSVTFISEIKDVTTLILSGISDTMQENRRAEIVKKNSADLELKTQTETKLGAQVKSFFGGNNYYLFITETFKDVRLVGVPPSSIGKFGADGDNWMWPRHTGDFSVFRIYANKENKGAEYSIDNIPYIPKYSLSINLSDIKENDFTLVYGFPARTTEYLPSDAIDVIRNISDPIRVDIRTKKLAIWDETMRINDTTRIKYAAKYASVANGWKKWQGEMKGIDRLNIIAKRKYDETLMFNTSKNQLNLNAQLTSVYNYYKPLIKMRELYNESAMGVELIAFCNNINTFLLKYDDVKIKSEDKKKESENFKLNVQRFYKNYNAKLDAKVFDAIFNKLQTDFTDVTLSSEISKLFNGKFPTSADLYNATIFLNESKAVALFDNLELSETTIKKDIAFKLTMTLVDYFNKNIKQQIAVIENKINELNRLYIKETVEFYKNKNAYPDANSTLRVAFGNVKPYSPKDGVTYKWYTTYKGILEKEDVKNEDYEVHPTLKNLFLAKDFGRYADKNNELRVAFIGSNHTTGGNSGSPVLNEKGELIGTNFDRCWEGTMSDIVYDAEQCRNIILDVHYTLFVIDKFAGAGYLLNEMKIVN